MKSRTDRPETCLRCMFKYFERSKRCRECGENFKNFLVHPEVEYSENCKDVDRSDANAGL